MFNIVVLDIAIGIIFVFLVYSLLASAINEIIAAMISQRGRMLLRGIQKMLNGESIFWWHNLGKLLMRNKPTPRHRRFENSLAGLFKNHTLFLRLSDNHRPAYLSDSQFSSILLDILHQQSKASRGDDKNITGEERLLFEPRTFESVKAGLLHTLDDLNKRATSKDDPESDRKNYLKRRHELLEVFSVMMDQANGDLQRLKLLIEDWYNETMNQVTGAYKRQTHQVLFGIGIVLAILFNVNAISIINNLSKDTSSREALVSMANTYIQHHPRPDTLNIAKAAGLDKDSIYVDSTNYKMADSLIQKVYRDARAGVDSVNTILGLGWGDYGYTEKKLKERPGFFGKVGYVMSSVFSSFRSFFGLLITAMAISFGSPFWFDLLNKLVNLRMAGKSPETRKKNKDDATDAPAHPTKQLNQPLPGSVG